MTRYGMGMCAIAALLIGRATSAAQIPPQADTSRPASYCDAADDPTYAYTPGRAVQVGGGAMFVASRERRYLDALRGPGGEPVRYKRTGTTTLEPNALTIIDVYEVTYDGAEKPVTIYLDAYHFDDGLRAPRGLTCGAPIGLAPPGPDLFQASRHLLQLALERGPAENIPPIPLEPSSDAQSRRGIVLDHFRMMALAARAAAVAGKPIPLDAGVRPPDSLRQRTVVVAFPMSCDGRTIMVRSIDLVSAQGQPAPRQGDYATGETLTALIPGLDVPAGSVAATFGLQAPRPSDAVKLTYTEACGSTGDVTLPLQQTPLRPVSTPDPAMPDGVSASTGTVRLQAQVDLDGKLRHVTYVGGPRDLLRAAIEAVRNWTMDPVRINRAPISTPVSLQVRFSPRASCP